MKAFSGWRGAVGAALALLGACSPTLDWRQFTPEDFGVTVVFPCRPDRHARALELAGAKAQMEMLVCSAGDDTFAVSFVDIADPAKVGAALVELRDAALRNVGAAPVSPAPFNVPGMTPNPEAVRLAFDGRLPDGRTTRERTAFFVKGLRLYQASVIGAKPSDEAVETFLTGLKLP
jgi:hypothetical protein